MNTQQENSMFTKTATSLAIVLTLIVASSAWAAENCDTDADCGDGFTCVLFEAGDCPVPVDFDGSDDGDACQTVEGGLCAPDWVAGCATDTDCGDGFTCVELDTCACDGPPPDVGDGFGSGGSGDAGAAEHDPEQDIESPTEDFNCQCQGSGDFYCEPQQIACETSNDCPSDWECIAVGYSIAVCADEPCAAPDQDQAEEFLCMPPHFEDVVGEEADPALNQLYGGVSTTTNSNDSNNASIQQEVGTQGCRAAGGFPGFLSSLLLLPVIWRRRRR